MTDEERKAIDVLQNCIADYVIGSYCKECIDFPICDKRNEDCYFLDAIDTVINLINKQEKAIDRMARELQYQVGTNQRTEFCWGICKKIAEECSSEKCQKCIKEYFMEDK